MVVNAREPGRPGREGSWEPPTVEHDPGNAGAGSRLHLPARPLHRSGGGAEVGMSSPDVVLVGGGVIGVGIAWRCAQRGLSVTVHHPAPGTGSSHTAAG